MQCLQRFYISFINKEQFINVIIKISLLILVDMIKTHSKTLPVPRHAMYTKLKGDLLLSLVQFS